MCASSAANRDDSVYKRRKLHRDTIALLSEENVTERTRRNSGCHSIIGYLDEPFTVSNEDIDRAPTLVGSNNTLDNGNPSISGWHYLQKPSNVPSSQSNDIRNLESVANTVPKKSSIREGEVPIESSVSILRKSASEHNSGIKDSCSSSKSSNVQVSTLMKTELEDIGVCSSSDIIVAEPLGEFTSAKELCISVLKHHGLLGGFSTTGACASFEVLSVADTNCSRSCKICGRLENPMKMLICDLCEEAFHVSCCNPRIEKVPVDEWYCQPCFRKKPKCVVKNGTTKSFSIGEHRKSRSDGDLGPIPFMLRDNQPYTTVVRIGKDFQAEVPEWSGPVYEASQTSTHATKKYTTWTEDMDRVAMNTFVEEFHKGNKAENGWKLQTFQAVIDAIEARLQTKMAKENIRSLMKTWKKTYTIVNNLLNQSGFGWNNITKMVDAPDCAWNDYLKSHSGATQYRNKSIPNYDKLAIIIGNDQAISGAMSGVEADIAEDHATVLEDEGLDDLDPTFDFNNDKNATTNFSPAPRAVPSSSRGSTGSNKKSKKTRESCVE